MTWMVTLTLACSLSAEGSPWDEAELQSALIPKPQQLTLDHGDLRLRGRAFELSLSEGEEHEACLDTLATALSKAGVAANRIQRVEQEVCSFTLRRGLDKDQGPALPPYPQRE